MDEASPSIRTPPGQEYLPEVDASPSSPAGYEIRREIGRGGMARVHLAYDFKHQRLVALKVLEHALADVVTGDRFIEEIRILAGLQHPAIVPLYDSGMWNGVPFFVMPYVEGESLRQRIARDQRMPIGDVLRIASELAEALERIHRAGYVHRDVKPENVLLSGSRAQIADFGIATALRSMVSQERLTNVGMVVGTPSYMAPEQYAGLDVDGRSDIFSLACMVHEMLTGSAPFGTAGLAGGLRHTPVEIRSVRTDVSPLLEAVIARGLSADPEARHASAEEFARDLQRAGHVSSGRRWRTIGIGAMVVAALAAGVALTVKPWQTPPVLDPNAYAVFPFRHGPGVSTGWLDGAGCARLLYDAMTRWRGVRLVNDMMASDVWSRSHPATVGAVLAAAESLHAGHVAWGEVVDVGDSLEVRATAYNVRRGVASARQFVMRTSEDMASLRRVFSALADSIVVGGTLGADSTVLSGSRDVNAVRAYLEGRASLDRFELDKARDDFQKATEADAGFAHAFLWLARSIAWRGAEPREWTVHAARAVLLSRQLPERERAHASALAAIGRQEQDDACRRYRNLIARDSTDFAAWIGLGDCNAFDQRVIRNPRSSSGWSYRGSFQQAVTAYRRALALVPSFSAAERGLATRRLTARVLPQDENRIRRGFALTPDTLWFGAGVTLVADTFAYTPLPYADVQSSGALLRPRGHVEAVVRAQRVAEQLSGDWVGAFPSSVDAHESWALALERLGYLGRTEAPSALSEMVRGVALARNAGDVARLRAGIVRIRLKTGDWRGARLAAESVLMAPPSGAAEARVFAGLATLLGRPVAAARYQRMASTDSANSPFTSSQGGHSNLPGPLLGDAMALLAFAALGAPADSVRDLYASVDRGIRLWAARGEQARVRDMLLRTSTGLAWDLLPSRDVQGLNAQRDAVLRMRIALSTGDARVARVEGDSLAALTAQMSPGSMGLDRILHLAIGRLALGDTAGATVSLDAGLDAFPRSRPLLLGVIPQAGSIGRAMLMRAVLAERANDLAAGRRWSEAVGELWAGAEQPLRAQAQATMRRRR